MLIAIYIVIFLLYLYLAFFANEGSQYYIYLISTILFAVAAHSSWATYKVNNKKGTLARSIILAVLAVLALYSFFIRR